MGGGGKLPYMSSSLFLLTRTPPTLPQGPTSACPLQVGQERRTEGGLNCPPTHQGLVEMATQVRM